jgi:hypothetical protein
MIKFRAKTVKPVKPDAPKQENSPVTAKQPDAPTPPAVDAKTN